ncbi:hypothetical protein CMU89_00015 [Elizabethkingia anophelis]|nr:hypothetical protein BBD30_11325 [Elizabethkingia anophelis]MDV3508538.1 hypothetical protein [Elizabethkingia anophelis]MDV3541060.1 hypothetical protein [Elizabethkingia anophelis]MDV3950686.1 hypothetical protein [Elizabethkingia anophelis]MDV4009914.1 hypothetical protein [Elizabethkingia anophelis]
MIFAPERKTLKIKYYETSKKSQKQIALEKHKSTKKRNFNYKKKYHEKKKNNQIVSVDNVTFFV